VPASAGGDDFVLVGGPSERLWLDIVLVEEMIDGVLEIDD